MLQIWIYNDHQRSISFPSVPIMYLQLGVAPLKNLKTPSPNLDLDHQGSAHGWEVRAREGAPDAAVQQDGFSLQVVCKDLIKQLGHRFPWCDAYGTIRLHLQNAVRSQQANTPIGIKGPMRGRPCSSPISIDEALHIPRTWLETTGSFLIPGWNFGFHRC